MKASRVINIVFGVAVLSVAPMLIEDYYKARKASEEFKRMYQVKALVEQKIEAYHQATGHYPGSIDDLSFTNSAEEIGMSPDLKKIRYRRTASDYRVGWDGDNVYLR